MAHYCRMFHFSMFSSLFLKKYKQNICQYDNLGSNYFPGRFKLFHCGRASTLSHIDATRNIFFKASRYAFYIKHLFEQSHA